MEQLSSDYIGKKIPDFLATDWILKQFAKQKKKARKLYIEFIAEGCSLKERPWDLLKGQIFLGGKGFIEENQDRLKQRKGNAEIPRKQLQIGRPSLSKTLPRRIHKDKPRRYEAIRVAHLKQVYTLKHIADHLGIHYTTVSKITSGDMKKK